MWLHCAGSLIANMMEEDSTSPEAAEGTAAHFVAETWLRSGRKPKELIGTVQVVEERGLRFEIPVTQVMMDYVQEYVDWCMFEPGEHYTETRVFFSELTPLPNQSGTADHAACQPGKLVITDLKYGKGIQVFAEEVLRNELKLPKKVAHEVLERYVRKPAGKPTLAPLSDKRPELESYEENLWDDEGMFDDDDDEL